MKFTLEIELGNEAMQSGQDVADALAKIGMPYSGVGLAQIQGCLGEGEGADIHDLNGNTVGSWEVTA